MSRAISRRLEALERAAMPTAPALLMVPFGSWPETEAEWDTLRIAPHVRIVLPDRAPDEATWEAMAREQQARLKACPPNSGRSAI